MSERARKRPERAGVKRGELNSTTEDVFLIYGLDTKDGPEHALYDAQSNAYELEEAKIKHYEKVGVLTPIRVSPDGPKFGIVYGRKRLRYWRESTKRRVARGEEPLPIPFMITKAKLENLAVMVAIENMVRTEATFAQRADMVLRLVEGHGMDPDDVGVDLGLSKTQVEALLTYNTLDESVRSKVEAGVLKATAALYLAPLPRAEQKAELAKLEEKSQKTGRAITVRGVRAETKAQNNGGKLAPTAREIKSLSGADEWSSMPKAGREALEWAFLGGEKPDWVPASFTPGAIPDKPKKPKRGENGHSAALFGPGPSDAPSATE